MNKVGIISIFAFLIIGIVGVFGFKDTTISSTTLNLSSSSGSFIQEGDKKVCILSTQIDAKLRRHEVIFKGSLDSGTIQIELLDENAEDVLLDFSIKETGLITKKEVLDGNITSVILKITITNDTEFAGDISIDKISSGFEYFKDRTGI